MINDLKKGVALEERRLAVIKAREQLKAQAEAPSDIYGTPTVEILGFGGFLLTDDLRNAIEGAIDEEIRNIDAARDQIVRKLAGSTELGEGTKQLQERGT